MTEAEEEGMSIDPSVSDGFFYPLRVREEVLTDVSERLKALGVLELVEVAKRLRDELDATPIAPGMVPNEFEGPGRRMSAD